MVELVVEGLLQRLATRNGVVFGLVWELLLLHQLDVGFVRVDDHFALLVGQLLLGNTVAVESVHLIILLH